MPAPLAHFAVNADDVTASRRFYEQVFGWRFTPWGPPGFFHIDTGPARPGPLFAALQQRRELVPGTPTLGFECTFAVDDVGAVRRAVLAHGGHVLMEPTRIEGVGELLWFSDPTGNAVGAMHYDDPAN